MKIRIVKAGQPTYWYADRIGEEFEVLSLMRRYRVKLNRPYVGHYFVNKEDCEEVTE
jgi:hypothetical protein